MFEVDTNFSSAKIVVAGVGGGGINAVNHMISKKITGLNFIAVDTDEQALANSQAPVHIQIDGKSPQEIQDEILKSLEGFNMVFIVAGMGGDTGTKLESIVANYAKGLHALTIAVVTLPLTIENLTEKAADGINNLRQCVDSVVLIFNDKLAKIVDGKISLPETFDAANEILAETVFGIANLFTVPGVINLDLEDVQMMLEKSGYAFVGIGEATGESAVTQATKNALNSPIFEKGVQGAHSILINICGGNKPLTMQEFNEASMIIQDVAEKSAGIMLGTSIDESFANTVRVTIIATRFYR